MKILLISPLPPPEGGIAIWTKKYKAYCEEHNQPLAIVNIALIGSRSDHFNNKRNYIDEVKRTFHILGDLNRQLKIEEPDIVHLNSPCNGLGIFRDLLCARMVKKAGLPLVLHCRSNIEDQLAAGSAQSQKAFVKMAGLADCVLTLNEPSHAYASLYARGKTRTVPNCIEREALNTEFTVGEQLRRLLFVGHVQKAKGAEEILRAAAELPDIEFQMVGPVHEAIRHLPCPPNVHFLGNRHSKEVKEYLKTADAFLFPSYTEGFSNALLEAMAAGLPCIATDVGANRDMIEDQGGVIVPVGDSSAIVRAVNRLRDPDLRRRASAWNLQKVENAYLIEKVMETYFGIYREVIGEGR